MLSTKKIIEEATSLPIEERGHIADSILRSMNSPNESIDAKWIEVAKARLDELRSGKVKGIDGKSVFAKIEKRFS